MLKGKTKRLDENEKIGVVNIRTISDEENSAKIVHGDSTL